MIESATRNEAKQDNEISLDIITEISPENVSMLKTTAKKYRTPIDFMGDACKMAKQYPTDNAFKLMVALKLTYVPPNIVSDPININGLVLMLFVSDNMELKKKMMAYLKSLEISKVNTVLDKYNLGR
jgi:hypothetical protein